MTNTDKDARIAELEERVEFFEKKLAQVLFAQEQIISQNESTNKMLSKFFGRMEESDRIMRNMATMPMPEIKYE
jgi:uncharacterized coiled-coil protein SlyX